MRKQEALAAICLLTGCGDAAKADYDRCVILYDAGNLPEAESACLAAVRADPKSTSGEAAKKKGEEIFVAKLKADLASKGVPTEPAKVDVPTMPGGLEVDPKKPLADACQLERLREKAASKGGDNPLAAEEGQAEFRKYQTSYELDGRWTAFESARFISLAERPDGYGVTFNHALVVDVVGNNLSYVEERRCLGKTFVCTFARDDKSGLAKLSKGSKFVFAAYFSQEHPDYLKPVTCRFLREY